MKKKYTWIAVIAAVLAIASAVAALTVFLTMKKKKTAEEAEEVPTDFDDYDIDFLLDSEDEDPVEAALEEIAEYAPEETAAE